jgi:hypothetical protein
MRSFFYFAEWAHWWSVDGGGVWDAVAYEGELKCAYGFVHVPPQLLLLMQPSAA